MTDETVAAERAPEALEPRPLFDGDRCDQPVEVRNALCALVKRTCVLRSQNEDLFDTVVKRADYIVPALNALNLAVTIDVDRGVAYACQADVDGGRYKVKAPLRLSEEDAVVAVALRCLAHTERSAARPLPVVDDAWVREEVRRAWPDELDDKAISDKAEGAVADLKSSRFLVKGPQEGTYAATAFLESVWDFEEVERMRKAMEAAGYGARKGEDDGE